MKKFVYGKTSILHAAANSLPFEDALLHFIQKMEAGPGLRFREPATVTLQSGFELRLQQS
jgi:hypothetical protein